MRSGGTRCLCICSVARTYSEDHADLRVAATWRQHVLKEFERIKLVGLRPSDDSADWVDGNHFPQQDHEKLKVRFDTTDGRLSAAEFRNQELETQLRIATCQIEQLTPEGLRTRNHAALEEEDFGL